jgi:hypothetical protein
VQIHVNGPPVAVAGDDFNLDEGKSAMLSGALSHDPDNDALDYEWTQTAGPSVVLFDAGTAAPSFLAPSVSVDTPLTFQLKVTDKVVGIPGLSSTDTVTVNVINVNLPPVANAGADFTLNEGQTAHLSGAGSTEPDGEAITYAWTQVTGPTVTLVGTGTATPRFVAPQVDADTPIGLHLVVTDPHNASSGDDVIVTVHDKSGAAAAAAAAASRIGDNAVGGLSPLSVLLLGLPGLLRQARRRRRTKGLASQQP